MSKRLLDGLQVVQLNSRKPLAIRPTVLAEHNVENIKDNFYDYLVAHRMTLTLGAEVVYSRRSEINNARDILRQQIAYDLYDNIRTELLKLIMHLHDNDFLLATQKAHEILELMT